MQGLKRERRLLDPTPDRARLSTIDCVTFQREGIALMDKSFATNLLGADAQSTQAREQEAARWIGVPASVYQHEWPAVLHPVMADRVIAANFRRELAKALGQSAKQYFGDWRNEALIEKMMKSVSGSLVMLSLMPRVPIEFARREIEAANDGVKKARGRPRLHPLKAPDDSAQAAA